jgi:AcrR family transcriptional regulator
LEDQSKFAGIAKQNILVEGKNMSEEQSVSERILQTAWKLFYEKGYENTTIDEIIQICNISKGGFYHYFSAKDDLLNHLSYLLDKQYEALTEQIDPALSETDALFYYTEHLFRYIEDHVPNDLLALVLSTQVTKNGPKYLLDERRTYFVTLFNVIARGQEKGEFLRDRTTREYVKLYAMQERAILYDWCLCEGKYPLATYGVSLFRLFVSELLKGSKKQENTR